MPIGKLVSSTPISHPRLIAGRPCKNADFSPSASSNETIQNRNFFYTVSHLYCCWFFDITVVEKFASDIVVCAVDIEPHPSLVAHPSSSAGDGLKESPTSFDHPTKGVFVALKGK